MDSSSTFYYLAKEKHVKVLMNYLDILPDHYIGFDTSRLTALYFCIVGLDILSSLHEVDNLVEIVNFVYSLQIEEFNGPDTIERGFIGSPYLGPTKNISMDVCLDCSSVESNVMHRYIQCHLAMAYTALVVLVTLGDNLGRLDREKLLCAVQNLQLENGCFSATKNGSEADTRFMFCACAICSILNEWSPINIDKAVDYIISCMTYEGGISLAPGSEAHGGSTYCGIASLVLMNRLESIGPERIASLKRWCMNRQVIGYQGRTNKDPDSCYSFWIGASLAMLGIFVDSDLHSTSSFLISECQCGIDGRIGLGFAKTPGGYPDILHTFYSICWLSMGSHAQTDDALLDSLVLDREMEKVGDESQVVSSTQRHIDTGARMEDLSLDENSLGELSSGQAGSSVGGPHDRIFPSAGSEDGSPVSSLYRRRALLRNIDVRLAMCCDRLPAHLLPSVTSAHGGCTDATPPLEQKEP